MNSEELYAASNRPGAPRGEIGCGFEALLFGVGEFGEEVEAGQALDIVDGNREGAGMRTPDLPILRGGFVALPTRDYLSDIHHSKLARKVRPVAPT